MCPVCIVRLFVSVGISHLRSSTLLTTNPSPEPSPPLSLPQLHLDHAHLHIVTNVPCIWQIQLFMLQSTLVLGQYAWLLIWSYQDILWRYSIKCCDLTFILMWFLFFIICYHWKKVKSYTSRHKLSRFHGYKVNLFLQHWGWEKETWSLTACGMETSESVLCKADDDAGVICILHNRVLLMSGSTDMGVQCDQEGITQPYGGLMLNSNAEDVWLPLVAGQKGALGHGSLWWKLIFIYLFVFIFFQNNHLKK